PSLSWMSPPEGLAQSSGRRSRPQQVAPELCIEVGQPLVTPALLDGEPDEVVDPVVKRCAVLAGGAGGDHDEERVVAVHECRREGDAQLDAIARREATAGDAELIVVDRVHDVPPE